MLLLRQNMSAGKKSASNQWPSRNIWHYSYPVSVRGWLLSTAVSIYSMIVFYISYCRWTRLIERTWKVVVEINDQLVRLLTLPANSCSICVHRCNLAKAATAFHCICTSVNCKNNIVNISSISSEVKRDVRKHPNSLFNPSASVAHFCHFLYVNKNNEIWEEF